MYVIDLLISFMFVQRFDFHMKTMYVTIKIGLCLHFFRIMFHLTHTLFSTHSTITLGNFLLSQRKNAGTPMAVA